MTKKLRYLENKDYKIYSNTEVVRLDYCDGLPRIKKVYKNRNGYYIKGQPYWEPASIYLPDYEQRLADFNKPLASTPRQEALRHFVETSVWNQDEFNEIWNNGNQDLEVIKKELSKLDKVEYIIACLQTSEKTDYICRLYLQQIIKAVLENE